MAFCATRRVFNRLELSSDLHIWVTLIIVLLCNEVLVVLILRWLSHAYSYWSSFIELDKGLNPIRIMVLEISDDLFNQLPDILLFIVFEHPWPINTSMSNINICLDIQYSCHSCFAHSQYIFMQLWVRANKDASIINLVKRKSTNKISICLIYVSIDNPDLIDIWPLIALGLAQLALV